MEGLSYSAYDRLTIARMQDRPTALNYIENIFEDFHELHGDRCFKDDSAIICGIGFLQGNPVTIVAQQKGNNTKENIIRNFGMPNPEGYRKALRIMKQAEKFNRPIVCFVDTPGAFCGIGAEERGQGEAIAKCLWKMSDIKVPIISILIGEGGSGGALALCIGDEIWMMENSIFSVLSPEGFAAILWKDSSRVKEAAELLKMTSFDLKKFGIIEKIIKEPRGGIHLNSKKIINEIKLELINTFSRLIKINADTLVDKRYDKFREIGKYN